MIIHWTPCFSSTRVTFTQPEPDKIVIVCRGKTIALDFSDPEMVEFDIPNEAGNHVEKAWREDGVLHLVIPSFDRLSRDVVVDHGTKEVLTWNT